MKTKTLSSLLLTVFLSATAWAFEAPLNMEDLEGRYRLNNSETQQSQTLEIKKDGTATVKNGDEEVPCKARIATNDGLKLELSCSIYREFDGVKLNLNFSFGFEKITREMIHSGSFTTPVTVIFSYADEKQEDRGVFEWRVLSI
ncbi:MAG: hypothetical protein OXB88_11375 [Bacteriovoracales bacterium]|nr:hypothetical protein [Bacteriovoracales bacterium]